MTSSSPRTLLTPSVTTTTSRRTLHKYLSKKCNLSAMKENVQFSSLENSEPFIKKSFVNSDDFSFPTEEFKLDLSSQILGSNSLNCVDQFNIKNINDKENSSNSISDILKDDNQTNYGCTDNKPDFLRSWLMNHIPFKFLEPQLPNYILPVSINKQEREIAYNLLIRRLVDETLDRSSMFSRQPKEVLDLINVILVRQFPEYDDLKHRCKVRNYLKACRRNFQKNNGNIIMKNTAPYLSTGSAYKLMHQIYNIEKETINVLKKESEKLKFAKFNRQSMLQSNIFGPTPIVPAAPQPRVLTVTNNIMPVLPIPLNSINSSVKPLAQIYAANPNLQNSQLPLLMPFNGIIHTESIKKTKAGSLYSTSEEIRKNINEITKILLDNGSNNNVESVIFQLRDTANFIDTIAETLEQSMKDISH